MVATAEKQKTKEKRAKWPTEILTHPHIGLNRHGRREWEHEHRGVAFMSRIATPTRKRQKLVASRRANRWLKREKSA